MCLSIPRTPQERRPRVVATRLKVARWDVRAHVPPCLPYTPRHTWLKSYIVPGISPALLVGQNEGDSSQRSWLRNARRPVCNTREYLRRTSSTVGFRTKASRDRNHKWYRNAYCGVILIPCAVRGGGKQPRWQTTRLVFNRGC